VMRGGVTWIPQQLWEPVEKTQGLWTICIHPNTASNELMERLRAFLEGHAAQFTSVERVLAEFDASRVSVAELAQEQMAVWRNQFARFRKQRALQRLQAKR
jgi:hypothetical protein